MNQSSTNSTRVGITTIGVLFFIFGFITWLNATLVPYLQIACELNNFQSYFVTFSFYISYFVMALPSVHILQRIGLKNGMMTGLLVMALGALLFIPAAVFRTYILFLIGLFVMGTGLVLSQTAANPYVIVSGPTESAARRMSIMGICNKVAGIISPLIMGAIVLNNIDALNESIQLLSGVSRKAELDALAHKAVAPYTTIMILLATLSVFVRYSPFPNVETEDNEESVRTSESILQYPYFWFGVLTLFLYVGVEVIAIDTIALYGTKMGFTLEQSKSFATYPLLAMIIGYLVGIACIPKYISQERTLTICGILGLGFTIGAIYTTGLTSVLFISLLGLAHSVMWSAIFPMSINGLGKFTKLGSAILIMAIAGGAILPLLYGHFADTIGNQQAYWMMLPCYIIILIFALVGMGKQAKKAI
ncbi:MAG: sugar MFS transporter [Prevotellaceae bacterium]|nr:sugar MFS transporter [Prevotellaceae bacterium]